MTTLRGIVADRMRRREPVTLDIDALGDRFGETAVLVSRLADALPAALVEAVRAHKAVEAAAVAVSGIGRIWRGQGAELLAEGIVADDAFTRDVDALHAALTADPPRPQLLVGAAGTGRTARLLALGARLARQGWVVLEAAAAEVNAGQTYVGQLDKRVGQLMDALAEHRILWIVPSFEELRWTGTYRDNPTGILDMVLHRLERRPVCIAGEIEPGRYERLLRERPRVRDAFHPRRVEAASEDATLALARRWAAAAAPGTADATLREALLLARHYLTGAAQPGGLLALLQGLHDREPGPLAVGEVLAAVSGQTGIPLPMLDERERLDLAELREFFSKRVIGQPEAVECLVERVALLKAGLTDPTRPQAVLLFVGPTGTGKTEIAKALAEHLFGSAERLVRVDLSEYQAPGSERRLLGYGELDDPSLLGAIRRQPFSVVLLDEFEKADPGVWDLFLQVFDDGRLSDPSGAAADFRHAVIVMTSNLGARIDTGGGVGFSPASGFTAAAVEQAVGRAFRPEFLNRIDRLVVFRPCRARSCESCCARSSMPCSPGVACARASGRWSGTSRRSNSCSTRGSRSTSAPGRSSAPSSATS